MDLTRVKLVVTDMDGTLLNSRHEVSDRFMTLFHELSKHKIRFVAASGRQHNSIVSKLTSIQEDLIIIAENGGLVRQAEQEWLSTPLDAGAKNKILRSIDSEETIYPVLCAKNSAFISNGKPEFIGLLREYYTEFESVENLYDFDDEVMKIAIYHAEDSETYIYPKVSQFASDFKVKVSGQNWVDISHQDAHKGYALNKVQQRLGISPDETMVFGDFKNDLEMMEQASFSFAMANAHPNVKAAARYHTSSNDEMGVELILHELLKQQS